MAESSVSLARDEFNCSICLDLLKDPVTVTCGHSYCMSCITGCWDQKRVYSCPQCRQTFTPRPVLGKNTILAEVVEKLKKTKRPVARPVQCYSGSGDVECDVCTGDKNKAVKSCLVCLNSYCQNHLEQHDSFFKSKKHNLMDATGRLQEMICPQHEKLLEIFCRTDQYCICYLCMLDEHKDHNTVSAAAERTEKQVGYKLPLYHFLKESYLGLLVFSMQYDSDSWLFVIPTDTVGRDAKKIPAENPGETEGAWWAERDCRVSQGEFRAEEELLAPEELFETRLGLSSSQSVSEEPVLELFQSHWSPLWGTGCEAAVRAEWMDWFWCFSLCVS